MNASLTVAGTVPPAPGSPSRSSRAALLFTGKAAGLAVIFYLLLYFPHDPAGFSARALRVYLSAQASVAAAVLRLFDGTASVSATTILGAFPVEIVLDCAALDVMALYVAAAAAFTMPWRRKLVGILAGVVTIAAVNTVRIVLLCLAGARSLPLFESLHQEILQAVMVAVAFACFAVLTRPARPHAAP